MFEVILVAPTQRHMGRGATEWVCRDRIYRLYLLQSHFINTTEHTHSTHTVTSTYTTCIKIAARIELTISSCRSY